MNSDNKCMQEDYKKCAGKYCKHTGKIVLRVKFIQKEGAFCEDCAADLLDLGLVEKCQEARADTPCT